MSMSKVKDRTASEIETIIRNRSPRENATSPLPITFREALSLEDPVVHCDPDGSGKYGWQLSFMAGKYRLDRMVRGISEEGQVWDDLPGAVSRLVEMGGGRVPECRAYAFRSEMVVVEHPDGKAAPAPHPIQAQSPPPPSPGSEGMGKSSPETLPSVAQPSSPPSPLPPDEGFRVWSFEEFLSRILAFAKERGSAMVSTTGGARYIADSAERLPDSSTPGNVPGKWVDLTRKGKYVAHVDINWKMRVSQPTHRSGHWPKRKVDDIISMVRERGRADGGSNYWDPVLVTFDEAFAMGLPVVCNDGSDNYVWEMLHENGKFIVRKTSHYSPDEETVCNTLEDALKAMKNADGPPLSCKAYVDRTEMVSVMVPRIRPSPGDASALDSGPGKEQG